MLGCNVVVKCEDQASTKLIREAYSAFLNAPGPDLAETLRCRITRSDHNNGWDLLCETDVVQCPDTADLLYYFEKSMTLWIQSKRPELFFTHAASLSINDQCVVIVGASGSGKSSLAWSLGNLGFQYLSDELAPIHPTRMHVEPYPHALCLKTKPISGPSLPRSTIHTSATMHVPAYELMVHSIERPCQIGALVFIDSYRNGRSMELKAISSAEAGARLYANGLNQLAHIGDGLPAATRIAKSAPSISISGGTVEERSFAIRKLLPV